jgi:hypothetical protein
MEQASYQDAVRGYHRIFDPCFHFLRCTKLYIPLHHYALTQIYGLPQHQWQIDFIGIQVHY